MAKEIRVTFTDKEEDLYNYIVSKSSRSAFLKDLAVIEMKREDKYINASLDSHLEELAAKIANKLGNIEVTKVNDTNTIEEETVETTEAIEPEYNFSIDDLGLDN